jgi:6-phosphogluconolactonase
LEPCILTSGDWESWPEMAAEAVGKAVELVISRQGTCNLMLTGGTVAERLYLHWSRTSALPLDKIHFYFGDERCVAPDHPDSNYALVMRTLPGATSIVRMKAENPDRAVAAKSYAQMLPAIIDVLLLGMGEDGHIASLFPHDPVLLAKSTDVEYITGPKEPCQRLTVTPEVIIRARFIFVLVTGIAKGKTLNKAFESQNDFSSLPVRLTLGGTWLLDRDASSQIRNDFKNSKSFQDFLESRW